MHNILRSYEIANFASAFSRPQKNIGGSNSASSVLKGGGGVANKSDAPAKVSSRDNFLFPELYIADLR